MSVPRCPYCRAENDAATALEGAIAPAAGDVSVCFTCAAIGTFTGEGLEVRRATPDEISTAIRTPLVLEAVALVNSRRDEWGEL